MALVGVHISGRSSPNFENQPLTSNLIDIDSLNTKLNNNTLSIPNSHMNEVNQIIFNSQINQKQCERVHDETFLGECEEVQLLPNKEKLIIAADPVSLKVILNKYVCYFHTCWIC